MAAGKIFICCVIALVLFNFAFYISGYNYYVLNVNNIIGIFATLGGIAVIVSIIPTVTGGGTVSWFASGLIMLGIFYSVSFEVIGYNIVIGIGLASNLSNMFNSSIDNMGFLPYLFFNALGLIGVLSGLTMFSGGSQD